MSTAANNQTLRHCKAQANLNALQYPVRWLKDGGMVRFVIGLLLILLPVLELALLIRIGQAVGVWATLALVVGAVLVGSAIISRQSLKVLHQTLQAMSEGRAPASSVLDGLFLLLAGGLLLMPGLISDVLAFILLVPPVRRAIARWSIRQVLYRTDVDFDDARQPGARNGRARREGYASTQDGPVIDGEFERLKETPTQPPVPDQRHLR
jgi:UPF0716 protein FxsA